MSQSKVFQLYTHVMPWEIDYCLLLFNTLSSGKLLTKSKFKIMVTLNLSSYIIDWNNSKLDKEYFIEKIHYYGKLLDVFDEVVIHVYDGNENYGHLDLQKAVVHEENDYYVAICPDQLFDKSILQLFEQSVNMINEPHFVLTPEIPKLWDPSWDIISNDYYNRTIPISSNNTYDYMGINRYEALHITDTFSVDLEKLSTFKFAGWLDLYSKRVYENFVPVPNDWSGYGQWDLYALTILKTMKRMNFPVSVSQYKLKNFITTSIENSNWNGGENRSIYKNRLKLNNIPDNREHYQTTLGNKIDSQLDIIFKGTLYE